MTIDQFIREEFLSLQLEMLRNVRKRKKQKEENTSCMVEKAFK